MFGNMEAFECRSGGGGGVEALGYWGITLQRFAEAFGDFFDLSAKVSIQAWLVDNSGKK